MGFVHRQLAQREELRDMPAGLSEEDKTTWRTGRNRTKADEHYAAATVLPQEPEGNNINFADLQGCPFRPIAFGLLPSKRTRVLMRKPGVEPWVYPPGYPGTRVPGDPVPGTRVPGPSNFNFQSSILSRLIAGAQLHPLHG
eukprot:2845571-Rhodomonas_salina.2